jgi:pimeloyl-ACP methyl ester carboxylesterase
MKHAIKSVQPKVLSDRFRTIVQCDVRAELAGVTVPILYLQAAQDGLVPAWCAEEIRRIRPDAKIIRIDGPHLLLQCEPERTADAVAEFVRSLP